MQPGTAAASVITIAEGGCPSNYGSTCDDQRGFIFRPNESLTYVSNSIFNIGIEQNLMLDTTAPTGFDTVTLGLLGSGGPTVAHTVVFNLISPKYWIGIFGLNPRPTNFTTFRDPQPSFMSQLVTNNIIPSTSYGYTAGNQYRLNKVYGSLTLGGYDENRFDTTKNISMGFYSDISRDLLVNLHSVTTDSGSPSNLLPGGTVPIFIDSTVGPIWLPESACTAFEQAFGLTYDNSSQSYLVNKTLHASLTSRNPNVTFTIGTETSGGSTVDIVLPYGAFDLQLGFPQILNLDTNTYLSANSSYYFPLKRATNTTQYTLGRTFLQEAYLIADYDRSNFTVAPCTWDQQKIGTSLIRTIRRANETGSDSGSSSTPVGAIAGGVVGGVVALIAIIGVILFFMRRKKRTEKHRLAELESKSHGGNTKTSTDSSDGKPVISAPMGGELGGGEIHELTAPHKQQAQEMDSPYKVDPNKHGYSEMEGGAEFFAPSKGVPAEMRGETPIYEMAGSDVQELPAPRVNLSDRKR